MKNSARDRETARSNFWSVWIDRYLYEAKNEKCIKGEMSTKNNIAFLHGVAWRKKKLIGSVPL